MAFFNNDSLFGYSGGVACAEGYDVDFGGYARIVEESCMDQLEIVKAMHSVDMQELNAAYKVRSIRESAGDEDDVDNDVDDAINEFETAKEGAIKDVFNKIKEGLKNFFAKVFGWIKSIWDKLVTFKKSNKSFAETYRPVVEEYADYIPVIEYTGFDYNLSELESAFKNHDEDALEAEKKALKATTDFVTGLDKFIAGAKKGDADVTISKMQEEQNRYDEITKTLRGQYGEKNSESISNEEIKNTFRGARGTQKFKASDIVKALEILEQLDLKQLKKYEAECKKSYADAEKTIKDAEARYKKANDDAGTDYTSVLRHIASRATNSAQRALSDVTYFRKMSMRFVSVYRECVIDFANQTKSVTIKAIAEGKAAKKKADSKDN